jgi:hypothetical protein
MTTPTTGRTYTNLALTVIAGLLAINTFDRARTGFVGEAQAQPTTVRNVPGASPSAATPTLSEDDASGRINPTEQRKQMITELRAIGTRLDRVEAVLRTGLSVKVTELPPGFGADKNNKGEKAEKSDKVAPVTAGKK